MSICFWGGSIGNIFICGVFFSSKIGGNFQHVNLFFGGGIGNIFISGVFFLFKNAEVEKLEDGFGCVILCRTLYLYSTSSVCSIGLLSMCQQQQSYFERRRCFFVYFSVCDTVSLVSTIQSQSVLSMCQQQQSSFEANTNAGPSHPVTRNTTGSLSGFRLGGWDSFCVFNFIIFLWQFLYYHYSFNVWLSLYENQIKTTLQVLYSEVPLNEYLTSEPNIYEKTIFSLSEFIGSPDHPHLQNSSSPLIHWQLARGIQY